jgi:Glycosyl transferase family 90
MLLLHPGDHASVAAATTDEGTASVVVEQPLHRHRQQHCWSMILLVVASSLLIACPAMLQQSSTVQQTVSKAPTTTRTEWKQTNRQNSTTTTTSTNSSNVPPLLPFRTSNTGSGLGEHPHAATSQRSVGGGGGTTMIPQAATATRERSRDRKDYEQLYRSSLHLQYAYRSVDEMMDRRATAIGTTAASGSGDAAVANRFPSVPERVRLYLGDWYDPPTDTKIGKIRYRRVAQNGLLLIHVEVSDAVTLAVDSVFDGKHKDQFDTLHYLNRTDMKRNCQQQYCNDMIKFLPPPSAHENQGRTVNEPLILFQFGDEYKVHATTVFNKTVRNPPLPVFKKFRRRRLSYSLSDNIKEAIIFKLKTDRHFGNIYEVPRNEIVPWQQKKNIAIFRGSATGAWPAPTLSLSNQERCTLLPRCWLALQHVKSSLVDAKLIPHNNPRDARHNATQLLGSMDLFVRDKLSMAELMQYKAIIIVEGNDVSSGLKWALFSRSVVIMSPPTYASWAMEELLIPWVHYVPIIVDGDDNKNGKTSADDTAESTTTSVERAMQWILDHDEEAQQIAHRGQLFIADLVLHPDVDDDEIVILDEIVQRATAHFECTTDTIVS